MAKTLDNKKTGAPGKAPAKQAGKLKGALSRKGVLSRSPARGEDKHSSAPRGAVSVKPAGRVRTFFREVRIEMKKVTWPPRKELIKSTGVVIVAVAIAAVFIGLFDALWNFIVRVSGLGS
jgi:preprotein translocase subunit SecE